MAANAEPLEPAGTEPAPRLAEALQGERPDFVVNPRRLAPVGKGVFIVVFGVIFAIAGTYAFWQAVQQARATGLAWGVLGTALLGIPFFLLGLAFAYGGVDALRPWRYWCAGTPTRLLLVGPRSTQEWPWASVDAEIVLEHGPQSTTLILSVLEPAQDRKLSRAKKLYLLGLASAEGVARLCRTRIAAARAPAAHPGGPG